nr:PREDICTED: mini-chromosome maintenance complex-binding protein [Bemisia tabaci]
MDPWNPTPEYWEANESECLSRLKDAWDEIPVVNYMPDNLLVNKQLVRFRGMIQDMFSPVYYMQQYEVVNVNSSESSVRSGKFQDSLLCTDDEEVVFDSVKRVNGERRPMYCVSIPCLNSWADEECKKIFSRLNKSNDKVENSTSGKRSAEDVEMDVDSSGPNDLNSTSETKRHCVGTTGTAPVPKSGESSTTTKLEADLNFPVSNPKGKACILNFYDSMDEDVKLNSIVEVVGFLANDPFQAPVEDGGDFEMDDGVSKLPPSLVPRIHVVGVKHLDGSYIVPAIPAMFADKTAADIKRLRNELKFVLTQLMLGDSLAAEYLIFNIISKVFLRQDLTVLGDFSLNITNLPLQSCPSYPNLVYEVLALLLLQSHYFQMSISSMNNTKMIPKKDYQTNRLVSGMLQLPAGTHLVLDETKFEAGMLRDQGVHNAKALSTIIKNQKMDYNFQYYNLGIDTDVPVIIFSEAKSMLTCKYQVKLEPDPSSVAVVEEMMLSLKNYLKQHVDELRAFILSIKSKEYQLSAEMSKTIESDFVQMRQRPGAKVSPDDLHSLLVVGRLYAISHGLDSLDPQSWSEVLQLEEQRKARLNSSAR